MTAATAPGPQYGSNRAGPTMTSEPVATPSQKVAAIEDALRQYAETLRYDKTYDKTAEAYLLYPMGPEHAVHAAQKEALADLVRYYEQAAIPT